MKPIDLRPPDTWPEPAQQLYRDFENWLARRRVRPRSVHLELYHFFREQSAQGLSYREFPASLWDSYKRTLPPGAQVNAWVALRCWLRYLYKRQELLWPMHDELSRPDRPPTRPRPCLSFEQVLRLMALPTVAEPEGLRDRAFFEMAYATGMRRGEMLKLNLTDVDLVQALVYVRFPKNTEDRILPLGATAVHYLERYLREARPELLSPLSSNALWLGPKGERLQPDALGDRLMNHYRTEATLGFKVTLHLLRHTCATHLLQQGAPLPDVQQLLGHRALRSTQIYTRLTPFHLQRVHARSHPRNQANFFDPRTPDPEVEDAVRDPEQQA